MAWNLYELRIEILREFARVSQMYRVRRFVEFIGRNDQMFAPTYGKGFGLRAHTDNLSRHNRTWLSGEHDLRRMRERVRKRNAKWLRKVRVGR